MNGSRESMNIPSSGKPILQCAASQRATCSRGAVAIHRPVSINLTQWPREMRHWRKVFQRELMTMFRKIMFALLALATIGAAAVPSTAQARGGWGGGRGWRGGRGWGGRGYGWGAVGVGVGLGLAAGYPYYGGGYGYGAHGPGPCGCWRTVRVGTPYGWRWRQCLELLTASLLNRDAVADDDLVPRRMPRSRHANETHQGSREPAPRRTPRPIFSPRADRVRGGGIRLFIRIEQQASASQSKQRRPSQDSTVRPGSVSYSGTGTSGNNG